MKLLLDQGLPRSAAALLRAQGHEAVHTGEIGMASAEDTDILNRARDEGRIIVTLDADLHAILALSQARLPSVVRIRIEGLRAPDIAAIVRDVIQQCSADLVAGVAVSVEHGRLRLRRLPLAW